jgi:hypothetical protein
LNAERATIPLQKMELDDLLLLRERTRSLWKADLEVEARRVAGQQK